MGYTHYYSHSEEIKQESWDKFLADAKKVANTFYICNPQSIDFIIDGEGLYGNKKSSVKIGSGDGEGGQPTFNSSEIIFNGVGKDSHETLYIARDVIGGQFCKTNRKPYDSLCTAVLVLYKHHFGDNASILSDGGIEGFQEGKELCERVLDIKFDEQFLFNEE